jgi:peroxiredoxin
MLSRRIALSLLAAAAASPALAQSDRPTRYLMLNRPAPAFALPRRGGGEVTLAQSAGRVLVLAFGGLWCADCIVDGANTQRLATLVATEPDMEFLYIHSWPAFGRYGRGRTLADAERAWSADFTETGFGYRLAFDLSGEAATAYAIEWFPSLLVIDRDGVIRVWRTDLGARGVDTVFAQARAVAAD